MKSKLRMDAKEDRKKLTQSRLKTELIAGRMRKRLTLRHFGCKNLGLIEQLPNWSRGSA
jgi:hypothetical protein